ESVLPVTLLGLDIVVSGTYPTTPQMQRFAQAGAVERAKPSAAAAACGPGGAAPLPREAGGFAAQLMGAAPTAPRPTGGPEIGGRRNLMGGDTGDGLPGRWRRGRPSSGRQRVAVDLRGPSARRVLASERAGD